jgi:thioredoxin reductase (NADPH)
VIRDYDLIIVGSGPAGLTAAIYGARAKLHTVVFEKGSLGGSIVDAELVENFPGFPNGVPGRRLIADLLSQVMKYGVEFKKAEVTRIEAHNELKRVSTTDGDYSTLATIIAGGSRPKELGIPGEEEFRSRGVFTCVMCEGNRFVDQEVAIIGGGDGGLTGGLYMARIASKVTLVEIMSRPSAAQILQERARSNPKIEILCSTKAEAIREAGHGVKKLSLINVESGEKSQLEVSGIFILAGWVPQTDYLKGVVELDSLGLVVVDGNLETSVPGVFAAGDIRCKTWRQAITAAGDGAAAALAAEKVIALRLE